MHENYPSFIFRDQVSNFAWPASNRLGMRLVAYHPYAHTLSIRIANSQGHTQFPSNSFVKTCLLSTSHQGWVRNHPAYQFLITFFHLCLSKSDKVIISNKQNS